MYEISPAWNEYYRELEPERREQILNRLLQEEPDDGSNSFRKRLFALRYLSGDDPKPSMDRYLWQCVNFAQLYDTSRVFRRNGRKEAQRFLSENGYLEAVSAGPADRGRVDCEASGRGDGYPVEEDGLYLALHMVRTAL